MRRAGLSASAELLVTSRNTAKRQFAGIKFTQRPKISIFAPQGRLVAPICVKLCMAERHMGPLHRANFHANRCMRLDTRPQKVEKFHFLAKRRIAEANPLTYFYKF